MKEGVKPSDDPINWDRFDRNEKIFALGAGIIFSVLLFGPYLPYLLAGACMAGYAYYPKQTDALLDAHLIELFTGAVVLLMSGGSMLGLVFGLALGHLAKRLAVKTFDNLGDLANKINPVKVIPAAANAAVKGWDDNFSMRNVTFKEPDPIHNPTVMDLLERIWNGKVPHTDLLEDAKHEEPAKPLIFSAPNDAATMAPTLEEKQEKRKEQSWLNVFGL